MKYFVDSSYIIALVNENDSLHEKALDLLKLLESNDCYISNLIMNEVVTVIGNKIDLQTSIETFNLLNTTFKSIDECHIKDFNNQTMIQYEKYNAKLSFIDSSIIICMNFSNIDNLISFDKEFNMVKNINLIGM